MGAQYNSTNCTSAPGQYVGATPDDDGDTVPQGMPCASSCSPFHANQAHDAERTVAQSRAQSPIAFA